MNIAPSTPNGPPVQLPSTLSVGRENDQALLGATEIASIVIEQPAGLAQRLRYDPDRDTFVPTQAISLLHARGFPGSCGWIAGIGEPPGPHWDVLLCSTMAFTPGTRVAAPLCGVFRRAGGDHKFVAHGRDPGLSADATQDDLPELWRSRLAALYPVVGPGEGWFGAAVARRLVQTPPTAA